MPTLFEYVGSAVGRLQQSEERTQVGPKIWCEGMYESRALLSYFIFTIGKLQVECDSKNLLATLYIGKYHRGGKCFKEALLAFSHSQKLKQLKSLYSKKNLFWPIFKLKDSEVAKLNFSGNLHLWGNSREKNSLE